MLAVPRPGGASCGGSGGAGRRRAARHIATGTDPGSAGDRRRRWDTDERGVGVADATAWQPIVATIAAVTTEDGWVAEQPEAHLLPHLETASRAVGLAITNVATAPDGTFEVDLAWVGEQEASRRAIRSALFALVGTIAETVTVIHEPSAERGRVVEVLTGSGGDGDGPFVRHGHTVRLRVVAPAPPAE